MASLNHDPNGTVRIQFVAVDGSRKTIRLGKCSKRDATSIKFRVESLLSACITGSLDRDTSLWLAEITQRNTELRSKLEAVGLVEKIEPEPAKPTETLESHIEEFIERAGATKKPGTIAVWRQVQRELLQYMPKGIALEGITKGHAKEFQASLKKRKLASLTVTKHVRIAKQILEDAVEWEKIPANPFARIRVSSSIPRNNVEVTRETIAQVMKHCDPTWQLIIALSRYGGLRCPSETLSLRWSDVDWEHSRMAIPEPKVEHHEGRGVRSCPIFQELRPYLEKAWAAWQESSDESDYVVNMPAYRAAANTGTGWKNANLRTQLLKRLRKAGVPAWGRLFHSMRASRQTELEREFPLHVICQWLGNSPKVAQRSYLLTTEADFAKAIMKSDAYSDAVDPKSDAFSDAVSSRKNTQGEEENLENTRGKVVFAENFKGKQADGEGFEPTVAFRLLRFSRPVH